MALIDDIRAKYPDPVVFERGSYEGKYCVGGALRYYTGIGPIDMGPPGFPTALNLELALSFLNPHLRKAQAMLFAMDILSKNDAGEFDKAWYQARLALEYRAEAVLETTD